MRTKFMKSLALAVSMIGLSSQIHAAEHAQMKVPGTNLFASVDISHPCQPDQIGASSVPADFFRWNINSKFKGCAMYRYPDTTDSNDVVLPIGLTRSLLTPNRPYFALVYRVANYSDKTRRVIANLDNMGVGTTVVTGDVQYDMWSSPTVFEVPAHKVMLLQLNTTDSGDHWLGSTALQNTPSGDTN